MASRLLSLVVLVFVIGFATLALAISGCATTPSTPTPPADGDEKPSVTELVFLHHSVGQAWLDGGLRAALIAKSYITAVNEITYGTDVRADAGRPATLDAPSGDCTDYRHWIYWFNDYMNGVKNYGGANGIVMIKPCFPNSEITGAGHEPGDAFTGDMNTADLCAIFRNPLGRGIVYTHGAYTYHSLADAFARHPNTLFVVCTAPPQTPNSTTAADAARAREMANWLKGEWLATYNTDHPALENVAVFDVFDVLANPDDGSATANMLAAEYHAQADDAHPNAAGNTALTEAFCTGPGNLLDAAWTAFRNR